MHGQGNGPSSLYSPCGPTAGDQGREWQQGKHPSAPALIMLPATCKLWLWDFLDQAQHKLTQVRYRTTSGNHPGLKMPFIFLTAKHFLQKKYVTFFQALQFFLFFFFSFKRYERINWVQPSSTNPINAKYRVQFHFDSAVFYLYISWPFLL